jgi:putative isomerase
MRSVGRVTSAAVVLLGIALASNCARLRSQEPSATALPASQSRLANEKITPIPESATYRELQRRLASGWNTWDVNSVTTQVLLPEGLAIRVGMKHNSTLNGTAFLDNALIGRISKDAEIVTPGPHSWDGSYTDLTIEWKGHKWRVQSAHDGSDLVILVTPRESKAESLPPTVVFSVGTLWNLRAGMVVGGHGTIVTTGVDGAIQVDCTCAEKTKSLPVNAPVYTPYLAADLTGPVGISAQKVDVAQQEKKPPRTLGQIQSAIDRQRKAYEQSLKAAGPNAPILGAFETILGWDTIYEPEKSRVISPVSRVWSVGWGGYVLFDWDTFFAATLAGVGDRDLAYANTVEILREETAEGFVPNYARPDGWKSFDRSEPPVGSITALGLYNKYHDRWFLEETFAPLLKWNRWWAEHRDIQGYLTWGSDGENQPRNIDDDSVGTRGGAILESGLDNSPMYDKVTYNSQSHLIEMGDVGLMSMYVADCDALATIADVVGKPEEAKELRDRSARYRAKLETMWDSSTGIFLNKDLHKGESGHRLSPTNFYPMMAKVATPEQAKIMIEKHLLNPNEFWGEYVIPSIERDDPAFKDQDYWRGRIWGPMNYLVYLGLLNYNDTRVRSQFAEKSRNLFLKEWNEKGHVHENYNGATGEGDDVNSSDRFYHWGALLAYIEYVELSIERAQPANQ